MQERERQEELFRGVSAGKKRPKVEPGVLAALESTAPRFHIPGIMAMYPSIQRLGPWSGLSCLISRLANRLDLVPAAGRGLPRKWEIEAGLSRVRNDPQGLDIVQLQWCHWGQRSNSGMIHGLHSRCALSVLRSMGC